MIPKIGSWSFIIGIALAIIAGAAPGLRDAAIVAAALGVLGLLVGLLNITDKEIIKYLVAAIALLSAAGALKDVLGNLPLNEITVPIISNIVLFVGPGAGVVALKAVYDLSQS